jgi:multidrug resistance efflux pump
MIIILILYLALVWLVFSKLELVKWNWTSGTITALLGAFILAVFLALLNFLTPSGTITVAGRVVEVTPNVSGDVVTIPVKPNALVKAGTVLFQINQAPFKYKVTQLQATLVGAKQQAEVLKANYEQATANVVGLDAQLKFHQKRVADIQSLTRTGASTPFREQDERDKMETTSNQLEAAKAMQRSAKISLESEIDGVNTMVAQTQAQLDQALWELEQTTVRAPSEGYVSSMFLAIGARALQARSAMSFVVASDTTIIGMFAQNGFRTIKPGAAVTLVFENDPGRLHKAKITEIPQGVGQGQIAVSGTLARTTALGGTTVYPALISIPETADPASLRLGTSGTATVIASDAGPIGLIAWVLIWINSYIAYL